MTRALVALVLVWASTGSAIPALAFGLAGPLGTAADHQGQDPGPGNPAPMMQGAAGARSQVEGSGGEGPRALVFGSRRDPFRLPRPAAPGAVAGGRGSRLPAYLPPGNQGLLINELILEGVLSENSGQTMIAIVTNDTHRAYFLRQNEAVYDGTVARITPGAIYFRQRLANLRGGSSFRYVVKRLATLEGESK
jgi:hypothetical protein